MQPITDFGYKNLLVSGCSFTMSEGRHLSWPYFLRQLGSFENLIDCACNGAGNYHIHHSTIWKIENNPSIIDAVKWKRATLAKLTKASLAVGDGVQFTSTKTGMTLQGRVEKIAIKYVTVRTNQGAWRVPANMLTKLVDLMAV